jgi:hypothetical protein
MNVTDTKPLEKCCSKCGVSKTEYLFIPKRNICKDCRNAKSREKYNLLHLSAEFKQDCNVCKNTKTQDLFIKNRKMCIECNNTKRRTKYENDETYRINMIKKSTEFKQTKLKLQNEHKISVDNKMCSCCNQIKIISHFRKNRLKCKHCERDDPMGKLKRIIRSRIYSALKNKNKNTIEYLGCNTSEYLNWLLTINSAYTLDNRGSEWHIDHVIPLSHFNLENEQQQLIAFNWRNTMTLSVKENLVKNNKIIKSQIEQHYKKLVNYHIENKLDLPQVFIDLFAKHLVAGSPLEPILSNK